MVEPNESHSRIEGIIIAILLSKHDSFAKMNVSIDLILL